jgi:glucuronate isomerase
VVVLDNPAAIRHFHESVTEIDGFGRLSGFIDDTRAFCSIPARHDMALRLDAGYLAGLVAAHRLDEDEALDTLTRLVRAQPPPRSWPGAARVGPCATGAPWSHSPG